VVKGADDEIFNYCKDKKIMYTRYADDLTFSGDFEIKPLMTLLHKVMFRYGFKINRSKTKILSQAVCQKVTNIVVNEKIQGSRTYRMKLRQEVHYIHKYGLDEHLQHISSPLSAEQYLASLRGRVGYALYINKNDDELKRYREYLFKLATELHHRL
jgi:RNA-directed DNA polymerase